MSNNNTTMFRVPYKQYSIDNWEIKKKVLMDAIPFEYGFSDFYENRERGIPAYMEAVGEIISPSMQDFAENYPCPVYITSLWYEKSMRFDGHGPHNHGQTGYSGIIYVDYDSSVHEPTRFFSPFPDPANGDLVDFQPVVREGDLILFPSSILHEAPINRSTKQRVVVSFNIMGEDVMKAYQSGLEKKPLTRDDFNAEPPKPPQVNQ